MSIAVVDGAIPSTTPSELPAASAISSGDAVLVVQGGALARAPVGDVRDYAISTHVANTANPHSVTKAQVGLGNVDNTADAAKPVSTATQTALDGKAPTSHTHTISSVTGLQAALDGKAPTSHTHVAVGISDFAPAAASAVAGMAVIVSGTSSASFQAAVDAVSDGGRIVVPPGTYAAPTITNGSSKRIVWEVWGTLSSTTQNWADVLPGGPVLRPGRRSATTGIPDTIGGYADLTVPAGLGLSAIDVQRVYVTDAGQLPSGSAQGRLNGLHYILDVQAGAYGVRQTVTGECNIVGRPGQTTGNGNYCGVVGLGSALAPASIGPLPDSVFGGNFYGRVGPGATGWLNATGGESDCETEAPVALKTGHQVSGLGAYRGTSIDAAFWAEYWTPGQSWKVGFQAGGYSPTPAIGTDGTFAKCDVPDGISYGLDLLGTPVSQSYLRGNDINLIPGEAQFSKASQVVKFGNPTTASAITEYWYSSGHGQGSPDARVQVTGGGASAYTGTYAVKATEVVVDVTYVRPASDNASALGASSFRWSLLYAATGTINTSDATLKKWRGAFSDAELDAIGDVDFGAFQWLDAVASKGASARIHAGALAQQVRDAFATHGLDASRYALWCEDPLIEEVDETVAVDVPEMEDYEDTIERVDIVDGRAVVSSETVTRQRQKMISYPVVDADGVAMMSPGRPGRPARRLVDPETGEATVIPEVPAIAPAPRIHLVPAMKPEVQTRRVARPVVGDDGAPVTRLGLRYDHLLLMRTAWLERELTRLRRR